MICPKKKEIWNMKNALLVTTISGFIPQFEWNDVLLLQKEGYQVHYASNFDIPIYTVDKNDLENKGLVLHHINIQKSPLKIKKNLDALKTLVKIINEEKIELLHCHNPVGGVVARVAAALSKSKPYTIYTAHGFHFYQGAPVWNWIMYYLVERFLAKFSDVIITINQEDYKRAQRFIGKGGRAERIPGVGLNTQKFKKNPEIREQMRRELHVPADVFHIVSVGELVRNKNHEIIIRSIAEMKDSKIFYSICGKGSYRSQLEKLIRELHLEKQVQLLGYRNDIPRVLQSADCFAFPSIREGLGMAAIEALACEVPVIAADNRGTREYMRNHANGVVCSNKGTAEYRKAIMEIKNSEKLRKQYGETARLVALGFDVKKTERVMKSVYKKASEI